MGMDWSSFETDGEDPRRKFESFAGFLFERWCRREYGAHTAVAFVNGAGGDGGVEAYASLSDGRVVGLQAKWFRDGLGGNQVRQIQRSLETAIDVRPALVRYVVALPRNLTDLKRGKLEKLVAGERERWRRMVLGVQTKCPGVIVEPWDETTLQQLLGELGSDRLQAFWFRRSIVTLDALGLQFRKAKESWLKERYVPELHSDGQIAHSLGNRLGDGRSRAEVGSLLGSRRRALQNAKATVENLARCPGHRMEEAAATAVPELTEWLDDVDDAIKTIESGLAWPPPGAQRRGKALCAELLRGLQEDSDGGREDGLFLAEDTAKVLRRLLDTVLPQHEYFRSQTSRWALPILFVGDPGTGKTHALANAVERRLAAGQPAKIIKAADCDPDAGWGPTLARELELPGWTEKEILDGLEAAAVRAEVVRTAGRGGSPSQDGVPGPVCAFIAVDGLDENRLYRRWQRRLQELAAILADHPRIRLALSIRPRNFEAMGTTGLDRMEIEYVHGDGDVPPNRLFPLYCQHYNVVVAPNARLRWCMESPLAVRLFCEEFRGQQVGPMGRGDLTILRLVDRKVDRFEDDLRQRLGLDLPGSSQVGRAALLAIVKATVKSDRGAERWLPLAKAIRTVRGAQTTSGMLNDVQAARVLEIAAECGLLAITPRPGPSALAADELVVAVSNNVVMDFLLADAVFPDIQVALRRKRRPTLPAACRNRAAAVEFLVLQLCLKTRIRFYEAGLWRSELDDDFRRRLQLRALSVLPARRVSSYQKWVRSQLLGRMPHRWMALKELVLRVARVADHPLGPRLVHEVLKPLGVSERDLRWSSPNNLPPGRRTPWGGYSADAGWANVRLADDDPWWSTPLLLAWGSTTLDNSERDHIRRELARWGSRNLLELRCLIETTAESNDPQMLEDVACSVYGAATLGDDQAGLGDVATAMHACFLGKAPKHPTDNAVIRHCAWATIQRAIVMGGSLASTVLADARTPAVDVNRLLPLVPKAAQAQRADQSYGPLDWDLAHYVLGGSHGPFFERHYSHHSEPPVQRPALAAVPRGLLQAAQDGKLGRFSRLAGNRIAEALADIDASNRRHQAEQKAFLSRLMADGRRRTRGSDESPKKGDPAELPVFPGLTAGSGAHRRTVGAMTREAVALLAAHARATGLADLTPHQFALGATMAVVDRLGWNERQFRGRPNGGKPRERLGMDIAILRNSQRFSRGTHGEQSGVMQAIEKYTWIATHEIGGYLADRLPIARRDGAGKLRFPPYPYTEILRDVPNPASRLHAHVRRPRDDQEEWPEEPWLFMPQSLSPSVRLAPLSQPALAFAWVFRAPPPDPTRWIEPSAATLPDWTRGCEWLPLNALVVERDARTQGKTTFGLTCFLFEGHSGLLVRDARSGGLENVDGWAEKTAGIATGRLYSDPYEDVWAPWTSDTESVEEYWSFGADGRPVRQRLMPACASTIWLDAGHEADFRMPAELLRRELGVANLREGRFLRRDGEAVAWFHHHPGPAWTDQTNRALFARRDVLEAFVKSRGMHLMWAAAMLREPSASLLDRNTPDRPRPRRRCAWVAVLREGRLELAQCWDRHEGRRGGNQRKPEGGATP